MECGTEDLLCQFLEIVKENDYASGVLTKWLGEIGVHAAGFIGAIAAVLKDHGEKLVGLAGFSFGIYRWWKYREHILHKRLAEYLKENDRRLKTGTQDLLAALNRPAPGRVAAMPLFAPRELNSVLRERNWDRTPTAATVHSSAQWQLSSAVEKIERQLKAGEEMIAALRDQLATAHLLRGAVAASAGKRARLDDHNLIALTAFRTALQVPGHAHNLLAKEMEAHQLRKLGQLPAALEAYQEVENLVSTVGDYRTQRLTIARVKRYQAEIYQMQASTTDGNGTRVYQGSTTARNLLRDALDIRQNFAPYQSYELLEQGDMHFCQAYIAKNLKNAVLSPAQLTAAETAYCAVLAEQWRGVRSGRAKRKLNQSAKHGVARVERARKGDWDESWLFAN
ncbi:MAG: hypothetical protein B7Z29_02295 [Hyphomicrobium sp. 12-62-95]|nr:MAG: hypothetical protein B7Z29_02295 [Hyphomicrobium sp. 12-62-95]